MSNEDDFVDIEDIEINNDDVGSEKENKKQNLQDNGFEENIQENIEKVNENKKEEDNNNEKIEYKDIEKNLLINNENNQENKNIENDVKFDNPNVEYDNNHQNYKEVSPPKNDFQQPIIKKKNTFNTFDNSIHIHNPVPLSKMQLAENKYYKIKEELNKKYFNTITPENPEDIDNSVIESKKYKEMISYLEQLNEVLTEILKSSRIQQKEAEKLKKKTVQKTPEQIYQEQQKMNDNQEKMIEVYRKQLNSLQNRLNQVSKENFMEELVEKNRKLDEEIEKIKITNKKLNNEQKLNEIVISKQNKNEQEDKANMLLKRMNMDYSKLIRENEKLSKKIDECKTKENENENKIKQLQEFVDKLRTIAKDMYNITDYENVKMEEKNEKKKEEARNQYKKRIEILKKKKESNIHKYQQEIAINQKKITNLQKELLDVEKELNIEQQNKNKRLGIPTPPNKNNLEENIMNTNLNNDLNSNNKNESDEKSENVNINNEIKEIKRCEDGSFENIMSNEETNNINLHINTNMNNIKEPNGKEIFDAKDLSNINPMNAMNEISVDVPFVENEDKKNKKPEFLDEGFDDKIKKEEKEENEEKDDKGEEIDKNVEEREEKEEEKRSEDEKDEEKKQEEEKVQMLNDIIKNEPKDEDIELEQLEEFQI